MEEYSKKAVEFRDRLRDIVWKKERVDDTFQPVVVEHKQSL